MREIKFRAWDKKSKKMLGHNKLFRLDCSNEYPFLGLSGGYYSHPMDKYDVEMMQFTGLKDKNGVEIYEGDVVRRTCDLIGAEHEDFTGIIKYECAAFLLEGLNGKDGRYLWDDVQELEILGNVHENPELLEAIHEKT